MRFAPPQTVSVASLLINMWIATPFLLGLVGAGITFTQLQVSTTPVAVPQPSPTSSRITFSSPSAIPVPTPSATAGPESLEGWEGCENIPPSLRTGESARKFIQSAFNEFNKLVPAELYVEGSELYEEYKYLEDSDWLSAPAIDFFGPASRSSTFRDAIRGDLVHFRDLLLASNLPRKSG